MKRLINKTCACNVCANVGRDRDTERERESEIDRGSAGYHVNRQRRHLIKITQKKPKKTSDNFRFLSPRFLIDKKAIKC